MNEYLAYIAATTGKLADALASEDVDEELIDSAGELISALVNGGPAEDIDSYSEGATAVEHFIDIVERREMKLSHFITVDDLSQFLAREDGWDHRADEGWSVELRTSLANRCNAIKASPGWADLVAVGLASDDAGIFYDADRTARSLGINTFPAHWKRLQADPLGGNWFSVMQGIDDRRLSEVLDFAREVLPLERLGSGPNSSASDEFRVHMALEFVVTQLSRFPGQGWDLLAICLRSPVIRSRNMAINTLESWPQPAWPPEARTAVADALAAEPEEKVRERLASLSHLEAKP